MKQLTAVSHCILMFGCLVLASVLSIFTLYQLDILKTDITIDGNYIAYLFVFFMFLTYNLLMVFFFVDSYKYLEKIMNNNSEVKK